MSDEDGDLATQLEEAVNLAQELHGKVQEKQDVIEELRSRIETLQESRGENAGDDVELVLQRLGQTESELEEARDREKEQENRARELELKFESLRVEKLQSDDELLRAQEKLEEMEDMLQAARQKTEQAADAEGRLGVLERNQKKTLTKCLQENDELHQQIGDLQEQLLTVGEAYHAMEEEMKEKNSDLSLAQQELSDAENEIQELKRMNQETEKELALAQDEVAAVGELEAETQAKVSEAVKEWTLRVRAVESELEQERVKNKNLSAKCDELKRSNGVNILEDQLKTSEERNSELLKEIDALKESLSESREELTVMANELLSSKQDQKSIIDAALEEERKEIEILKHKIAVKDDRIAEERSRHEDLLNDKAQIEKDLQDREFWMAEYEKGHGLTEAVAHQKKLKADIKRRDKEIARLNQLLSQRIAGYQKLSEVCRRLKQDAGIPSDFAYDDIEIEEGMKGEVQRLEGLIKELETQNSSLEDERLRLLQSLRVSAQTQGEKGMKYYGLSAEQMGQVNEFVENLRDGRVDLPLNDRSRELMKQLEEMKEHVREAQHEAAVAEARLSAFQENPVAFQASNPALGDQQLPSAPHTENPSIADHLELMAQKQESLVRNLEQSIQEKFTSITQQKVTEDTSNLTSTHDARLDQMLAVLEKRLDGGQQLNSEQVREMQTELQRLMVQNTRLQEELVRVKSSGYSGPRVQSPKPPSESSANLPTNGPTPVHASWNNTQTQMDVSALGAMALSAPSTDTGTELHNRVISDLHLPPEKWSDQFVELNAQLVECLEELAARNKTIEALQKSLKNYSGDITELTDRQALLYREHALKKRQWTEELKTAEAQRDDALAEKEALQAKSRRLDTVCAVLEGGEDNVRDHVRQLTRKLAYFEVNEVVMARKYNLLVEEERQIREEKQRIEKDFVEMEATLKERCLYLEQWKANAKSELNHLHQRLSKRVPQELHEAIAQQLATTKDKLRRVMVEQTEVVSIMAKCQSMETKMRALTFENQHLKVLVEESQQRVDASRKQVEWMQEKAASGSGFGDEANVMNNVEKLVQQIAAVQGQLTEKEIMLSSSEKRCEIQQSDRMELQEKLKDVEDQLVEMRKRYEQQNEMAQQTATELEQLREATRGGATSKERTVLEDRIHELEAMYETMSREITRSSELADIASNQVQSIESIHQSENEELSSLRERLRDANSRTDDDTIIGKLQHSLTTLRASYKRFVKEHERVRAALGKKDLQVRKLELLLDEKEAVVYRLREQAQNKVQSLEAALDRMRGDLGSGLDGVSLYRVERLHVDTQELASKLREAESLANSASRVRENLQLEVDKQSEEIATLADQCQNYEMLLRNMDDENRMALSNKLVSMTAELKTCRFQILKHDREISSAKSQREHLERINRENEEHIERLEQTIAQTESERHLVFEQNPQLSELPLDDTPREDTTKRRTSTTSVQSLIDQVGNRTDADQVSVENLKHILSDMQQQNQDLAASRATVAQLQAELRKSDQVVLELKKQVEQSKEKVSYLRKRLEVEGVVEGLDDSFIRETPESNENNENMAPQQSPQMNSVGNRKRFGYMEADNEKTKLAAQKTIASLKEIVDRKNKIIDKYKHKIKRMQLDALASRDRDQAEIERLTERLYDENKEAIGKLRTAFQDISNSSATGEYPEGPIPDKHAGTNIDHAFVEQLVARNEETDLLIESKEKKIRELEEAITEAQSELVLRMKRQVQAEEQCERLQEQLRRVILKSESQSSDRTVKQLKAQVIAKEKKIAGLRSAVVVLKTEFVKAEEEYNLIKSDPAMAASSAHSQQGEHDDTERHVQSVRIATALKEQVEMLKERVEQTREDLERAKETEDKQRIEIRKLRKQISRSVNGSDQQAEELSAAIADTKKYQRQVDALLRENKRLKETVAQSVKLSKERRLSGQSNTLSASDSKEADMRRLSRRVKVLEAQNAAMRSAALAASQSPRKVGRSLRGSAEPPPTPPAQKRGTSTRDKPARPLSRHEDDATESRLRTQVATLSGKVNNYKKQVEILQAQVEKLKSTLSRQQGRKQDLGRIESPRLPVTHSPRKKGVDVDLTSVEDHMKLRDELYGARSRIRDLEARLERMQLSQSTSSAPADDDAVSDSVTELRFELAQQAQELVALKLRNSELESFRKTVQRRGATGSKYNVNEMENVVESMKDVISKLKLENERLSERAAAAPKNKRALQELKQLRQEHTVLQQEVEHLREDAREVRVLRTTVSKLERTLTTARRENKMLKAQRTPTRDVMHSLNNDFSMQEGDGEAKERVIQLEKDVERKEGELVDKVRKVKRVEDQLHAVKQEYESTQFECDKLRKENKRLVSELSAFDLDFFEEIEDLKYRYHQLLQENKELRAR